MNTEEKRAFNKELVALAIPLALQNLLSALVGASDALMLGRLTQEAIAAVSLANQVSFVMSLFNGAAIGAIGVLIAQYYGKKDYVRAKRFQGMMMRYVIIISGIFFLLAFFLPEQLMAILTSEAELISIGSGYLRIVSFSYLFAGAAQCYLMMMKIAGYAKISVWVSAVSVIVDIVLDFFLIYGIGVVPALGANGSAYSTVFVELIALVWCVIWASRRENVRLDVSSFLYFSKMDEKDAWKIIPGVLASSLSWGLSITMHSYILGHLGTDATAASAVTGVAQQLIQCLAHGVASGAGIMIGGLLGKNQLEKAKEYGHRFWGVSMWCGIINVGLICVIGPLVYFFYVLEPTAKMYLIQMLIFSAFYMFAFSFNTVFTCGVFPAGGDSKYDAVSVFFATWCFALPLALLGCFVFHWPVMVVYAVMCMDEIIKVPFIPRHYKKYIWVKNLTREEG
ncbi:MAG: MATE family efflux transporter [Roseburia sp.]|nr:MATE family efflux transporter [Roseburia sp.]